MTVVMLVGTVAPAVEMRLGLVAFAIEPLLDTVTLLIEAPFDAVSLLVEPFGLGLVTPRLGTGRLSIEAIVDALAPFIKAVVDAITLLIEALVDALATRVQSIIDAVAAIVGHRGGQADRREHQKRRSSSSPISIHVILHSRETLHGPPAGFGPSGFTTHSSTCHLSGDCLAQPSSRPIERHATELSGR